MFTKWNLLVFGLGLAVEGEVERRYGHKEDKPRILDRRTFRMTHVTVSLGPGKKPQVTWVKWIHGQWTNEQIPPGEVSINDLGFPGSFYYVILRLYVTEYKSPGKLGIQHKRLKEGQWEIIRPFENRNLTRAQRISNQVFADHLQ